MKELNLGFLASHGGSNMQAIINEIKEGKLSGVAARCVISNNSSSLALDRARREGIPAFHISSAQFPDETSLSKAIIDTFDEFGVNVVILAGYMKKLPTSVINHFDGRVLNIHPALLPKFGGEGMYGTRVHEAVIASGEKTSGATIHVVNDQFDSGRILAQMSVPVLPDDSADTLALRVLSVEHVLYADTLRRIVTGEIEL